MQYTRLVAQIATAALRTTCLQFQACTPPLLAKLANKLGNPGRAAVPAETVSAAALALSVGK
jgi:hypothetical protein